MRFERTSPRHWLFMAAGIAALATASMVYHRTQPIGNPAAARDLGRIQPVAFQVAAPDPLDGGVAWLNTGGPIRLRELKGKIVILDFWTYCCINCHHILPTLAKLEEKYKNELVVIGVHTPKFTAEQDTENLRSKVREYNIKHPVVNDANQLIWNNLDVSSWPTLMVFGPGGEPIARQSGEVSFAVLDEFVGKLVAKYKGELNETPIKFFPENEKPDKAPLHFPGKVLADAASKRLFIADTGHNRIVMTDLAGKNALAIGNGTSGMTDGDYAKAEFNRPQGMALLGETLYVADTENHAIRAIDLKAEKVTTVAGTGHQAQEIARERFVGSAKSTALSSPWDLAHAPDRRVLYVAMAGTHQLWRFDTEAGKIGPWAGTGKEDIVDAGIGSAAFAQPSGLATDGAHLFVADSEGSAVRSINVGQSGSHVNTIVGTHDLPQGQSLFAFDDVDGKGHFARLQHCLGVAYGDGKLFIADTYNNKIKVYDPKTQSVKTLAGTGQPGEFYQPGGLSVADTSLYVADTNNLRIRVIDLGSDKVSTLEIEGLNAPSPPVRKPGFPNATTFTSEKVEVAPGESLTLSLNLPLPEGFKPNAEGSMPVVVETPDHPGLIDAAKFPESGVKIDPPAKEFQVTVPLARPSAVGDRFDLKVSVLALMCSDVSKICTLKSFIWNVPVTVTKDGPSKLVVEGK